MFESKNGKKYGSAYVAKRHDTAHDEANSKHEAKESKSFEKGEQEGASEGMDQHEVVKAHGPAVKIVTTHDHEAHKHHVMSHHKDGHVNESDHETPEEAHEEGGKLANISLKKSGEAEDQQLAESEGGNEATPDGFEMPPLV